MSLAQLRQVAPSAPAAVQDAPLPHSNHDVVPLVRPDLAVADRLPVKIGFEGHKVLLRAFMRLTGAALILCAPGLWLLPGASFDPDLTLYKLAASTFFMMCGLALLVRNKAFAQPEVYFDPIRREMRILQRNERGRPQTVLRRSYDTLGAAKIRARQLEIWDVDGSVLLKIPFDDPEARDALRHQLGALVR